MSDRPYGTGSVYKRADGYFIGAVRLPDDTGTVRRRTVGGVTKHLATERLDALIEGHRIPTTQADVREVKHEAWTEGHEAEVGAVSPYRN